MRRGAPRERKRLLTFEEKITAAHMYYVQDIDRHTIAFALGCVNSGRVAEACTAVRAALRSLDAKEKQQDKERGKTKSRAQDDIKPMLSRVEAGSVGVNGRPG